MLWLADVPPELRWQAFEYQCFMHRLAATTASTYWTTWLTAQKVLQIPPSRADARATKILKARSTTYPIDFPAPMTATHLVALRFAYEVTHPVTTAIVAAAWVLGQRFSDLAQLALSDIELTSTHVCLTVRRGKVMTTQTPYTLFLNVEAYPANVLAELMNTAASNGQFFLCSSTNQPLEREATAHMTSAMLKSIDESLELRSIRRGGLQAMALAGHTLPIILQFSRHTSEAMLMRYLNWGAQTSSRTRPLLQVAREMEAAIAI